MSTATETPAMSAADLAAHAAASYVRTRPAMPAEFSDDLDRALYREALHQIPAGERSTCPTHLNWRDRCRNLHEAGS